MEYVHAFSRRGPAVLDEDVTRDTVVAECRFAALELMAGVAAGWRKIDLALWLTDPYARATRHVARGERVDGTRAFGHDSEIPDASVEEILVRVRAQLLASLESAALSNGEIDFVGEAVDRHFVRRAKATDGAEVWVPVDLARMRLRDRVRALFAADWLNDPQAWSELFVCHRCEAVVFDEDAKRVGFCAAHKRLSGFVTRERDEDARDGVAGARR